jgi:hypothetical protein
VYEVMVEKENKNIVKKIIYRINSNAALAILFYTLTYLIVFYLFTDNSRWPWIYITRSLSLGTFSGLFFRFVIYAEGYDWKKRLKIALWIMIGVAIISAVVEIIIKRIT